MAPLQDFGTGTEATLHGRVVITDAPKTLPPDGRCPKCRADESRRVALGLAGLREACGQCGYEFPEEPRG